MKKKTIIFLIFIVIIYFLLNFKVAYYAIDSSSGTGSRILDITYNVNWGIITSCKGTYLFPAPIEQRNIGIYENIEQCNVARLKKGEYNVPLKLMRFLNVFKINKEFRDGPRMYQYKVIF